MLMPMLYFLGVALIIALIFWFLMPGLPVLSILPVMAVAFLVLFSLYLLITGLAEVLAQFRRLLFGAPPPPETRMTNEEVTALAAEAFAKARINDAHIWPTVEYIEGRLIWIIGTPAVGSGSTVHIDDATGEVGPVEHWGFR
jgi:hypothetical protein